MANIAELYHKSPYLVLRLPWPLLVMKVNLGVIPDRKWSPWPVQPLQDSPGSYMWYESTFSKLYTRYKTVTMGLSSFTTTILVLCQVQDSPSGPFLVQRMGKQFLNQVQDGPFTACGHNFTYRIALPSLLPGTRPYTRFYIGSRPFEAL